MVRCDVLYIFDYILDFCEHQTAYKEGVDCKTKQIGRQPDHSRDYHYSVHCFYVSFAGISLHHMYHTLDQ